MALYREPELLLYDLGTEATSPLHDSVRFFGWAPDGETLFVGTPEGLEIIDRDGSVLSVVSAPPHPSGWAFQPFSSAAMSAGVFISQ